MKNVVLTPLEIAFYDAQFDAEVAYAAAPKVTQAQVRAADITKYRTIVQTALLSGQNHLAGTARAALYELTGAYS
jgi:hypothetical protein